MPEILIISNEQCILEIVDQLRAQLDIGVDIVNDFSQGLKEIFFRQPAVVFVQNEIGGIPGEKVANQVRALLEGEPIRLVLLYREADSGASDDSNFDGSIDISLPSHELIYQIQQLVHDAVFAGREQSDNERQTPQESPNGGDEYKIESLAEVFPAPFPDNWNASLNRDANAQATSELSNQHTESITPYKEFSFDEKSSSGSLPVMIDSTAESDDSLILTGADLFIDTPHHPFSSAQGPQVDMGQSDVNELKGDQMASSASSNGEVPANLKSFAAAAVPKKSVENGSIDEIPPASTSSLETTLAVSPVPSETVGKAQTPYPTSDRTTLHQSVVRDDAPSRLDGMSPDAYDEDYPFRQDLTKKSSLLFKMLIGTLTAAIIFLAYLLARDWWGWGEQETVRVPPPAPRATAQPALPAFIPRVAPDSSYAAAHPGWERREADGIEYLIFRERGRIKAIQIVAGANGVISVPQLKTCIKETTGLGDLGNWVREKREGFLVEKGALPNKGELAVYRKMPEGDIRGLVIVYY